jgi:hypothetical protein
MAKYMKKPVMVDAIQWFKNGDHPDDDCHIVYPNPKSMTQFEPFKSEGKIVRHYRSPDNDDFKACSICNHKYYEHGWIDTLEGGHIVCPGDWIITGVKGEHYPCKPDIFELTYEKCVFVRCDGTYNEKEK